MSVDTLRPARRELRPTHATVQQLLALARKDSDRVSVFVDGTDWEDARGCILVVPE